MTDITAYTRPSGVVVVQAHEGGRKVAEVTTRRSYPIVRRHRSNSSIEHPSTPAASDAQMYTTIIVAPFHQCPHPQPASRFSSVNPTLATWDGVARTALPVGTA